MSENAAAFVFVVIIIVIVVVVVVLSATYLHTVATGLTVRRGAVDDVGVAVVELSVAFSRHGNNLEFL